MIITKRLTPKDLHPKDNHDLIENLPELFTRTCSQFSDPVEKGVFLFSSLGVLSGCLPNYIGNYDGKWVSPHLYLFVLAPYGTGKGSMSFARYLGSEIHKTKKECTRKAMAEYMEQIKAVSKRKKGDTANSDTSAIPVPPNEMLYIPADNSKSALVDTLNDNRGSGIIFETEGDTLAAALKQDFGTFMDILLKAYHHEPISFMRRQNKETKEVDTPRLSIVLSSTYDQFLSFIRSAENGLVSRFAYYLLPENKVFRDVFADDKQMLQMYFVELGKMIEQRYNEMYSRKTPLIFLFTKGQKDSFNQYFYNVKAEADGLEGSVNRLALMTFRIAMVLTYFRHYEYHGEEQPDKHLTCIDRDFTNALAISKVLQENAETVHALLPKKRGRTPGNIDELYDALTEEFTTKEALTKAKDLSIAKRKCERFLEKDERIKKIIQGKYLKIK